MMIMPVLCLAFIIDNGSLEGVIGYSEATKKYLAKLFEREND